MTLASDARLGPYEIGALVGSGGMGEVYRARDPRLGRDVAIKVLAAGFSNDPDRLRRFELEARAVAALNHPGILAVYDIGTEHGAPYIVSELLEGETLRDRLNNATGSNGHSLQSDGGRVLSDAPRGGLAMRKAVDYAIQVARGLAAAHDKGITHRDLKPENLFITTDGRVKILDFGLAKLTEVSAAPAGGTLATAPATEPGMLLGTMGYMAPEQVRGQTADHRSDIFAFGAILYEMLSGQRAFRGATTADTISAILDKDPPDLPTAERHIPPALARVVDRCLEKSPAARFQSTHDLAFALEGLSSHSESGAVVGTLPAPKAKRRDPLAWALVGVLALVIVASGAWRFIQPAAVSESIRFPISSPPDAIINAGNVTSSVAVSPDGRRIVFAANRRAGGQPLLWMRSLDSLEALSLPGTEQAVGPFWSPDSRFIGFFADGKLKKIDILGAASQTLCDAPNSAGGTWNRDGVIVFGSGSSGLSRVPAAGGQPTPATTLDRGRQETSHRFPFFLPAGRRFVYLVQQGNALAVGSLDSPEVTRLVAADSQAMYARPGHLLFVRQGTLFAQPFDVDRLKLSGEAAPVAERVGFNSQNGNAAYSVSDTGVLVYRTGTGNVNTSQLTWFDRTGKTLSTVGAPADYRGIELAPDARRVAVHPHELVGGGDIWLRDLARETTTRLTFGAHNTSPVWSPDGTRIAFGSNRPPSGQASTDPYGGSFNLYEKRADGTGDVTVLFDSVASKLPTIWMQPTSWSPDGQLLVFERIDPITSYDIWVLPLAGDRKPRPLLQSEFQELEGQISPDGRWLAYSSNETRRLEVYVRPLAESAGKWQISTTGGSYPRWRHDGKELFYLSADRKLMAVQATSAGPAIEAGIPHALFDLHVAGTFVSGAGAAPNASTPYPYAVTADGQRFLVSVDVLQQQAADTPLTVVVNWMKGLKK